MARYRNRIVAESARVRSDWTLLLDSDVTFPATIVEDYLAYDAPDVAMFTPRVEHNIACSMCSHACRRPAYYDTFALRDSMDRPGQIFSCNPFWDRDDRERWTGGSPVDVHCAFGGAALVRSDVLAQCRWKSDGDCEHVLFAGQLRRHGRILAVPAVRTWTTATDRVPSAGLLRAQRELLRNPLLLKMWTARNSRSVANRC
jgi:hypothetical protein